MPQDLCFSAFHRKGGQEIPYARKSDDKYEARAIFKLFRGKTVTLGEIKKKIVLETPFVYHAMAMRVLAHAMKIVHVIVGPGEKRSRGKFLPRIPMSIYQRDGVGPLEKYGNHWRVVFASRELSEAMELFLYDQNENWMLLALWVQDRIKAVRFFRREVKRKELNDGLGRGKNGKRLAGSVLTPVLKMMVERKDLVKKKMPRVVRMEEIYTLP